MSGASPMIWLLGGYMWLFIHRPFEVWPWLGELHVERMYMIVTILCWALAVDKRWVSNRLNVAFVFFWIVLLAAWAASPYGANGTQTVENYFKVVVFYVLVMSTVRSERDLKLLVIMFLGAMSLYMAHSLSEYHNGRHEWRMGTVRMVGVDSTSGDPNSFAGTIVYSLPLVFPLWFQFQNSRLRWALVGYVVLASTCVLLTGSRMGFVGLCSLALVVALLSKHRLAIITLLAVAAPLAWIFLPKDRQDRYLTLYDPSYGPVNAQASAEGRIQGFYDGVEIWSRNPILGIGPAAFGAATGRGMQAHNLYGQVLGELGTLGATALVGMIIAFAANMLTARQLFRAVPEIAPVFPYQVCIATSVTIVLLLILGMVAHNLFRPIWLWLGAFEGLALHCMRQRRCEPDPREVLQFPDDSHSPSCTVSQP